MARNAPRHSTGRSACRAWLARLAMVPILLAAFHLRALDARHVFARGRVLLPGYDPHYHLRRIQMTLAHFPHVPRWDPLVNHPTGAAIYWPAGFDLGLAALAKLCGARPWSARAERVCAWAMPCLGLGVVAAAGWLGALWRGRAVGLGAALGVAVLPAAVSASAVGRVDHDVAVALLTAGAFAGWLAADRAAQRAPRLVGAAAAGAVLGLTTWLWPAAILFVVLPAGAALAQAAVATARGRQAAIRWDVPRTAAAAAAATVGAVVASERWAGAAAPSFAFLSGIHVAVALVAAGSVAAASWLCRARRLGRGPRLALLAAAPLTLTVLAFLARPAWWHQVGAAAAFVGRRGDQVLAQAGEARGLLAGGLGEVADSLTWAVVVFPLGLAAVAWRAGRGEGRFGDWLVAVWAAAAAALAVAQRRFGGFLAVPFALCVAALARQCWAAASRLRQPKLARGILAAGLAAALALPLGRWSAPPTPPNWELRAVLPILDWLRTESPPDGSQAGPQGRPAYGVLAFWHYGHWLTHVGRRANVACPFGNTPTHRRGLADAQAFLAATREADAAAVCRWLAVRYVLSADLPRPLVALAAGLDPRRFREYPLMANRLQSALLGPRPGGSPPLRHFRLVVRTAGRWPGGPPYRARLFEFVRGARLVGQTPGPGTVRVRIDLDAGDGPPLRYLDKTATDAAGRFEVRVPYATAGAATPVRAAGPAEVSWTDGGTPRTVRVRIAESDVQAGADVACRIP